MKNQVVLLSMFLALGACSYNASLLGSAADSSIALTEKPTSTTMTMFSSKPWYQDATPSLTLMGAFEAQKVSIFKSADCSGSVWAEKTLSAPVTRYVDVVSPTLPPGTHRFSARARLSNTEQTECIVMTEPVVYSPLSGTTSVRPSEWGEMMSLKADGSVALWGDLRNSQSMQVVMPQLMSNVVRLGTTFPGALKSDGSLVYWGWMAPLDPNVDFSKEVVDFAGWDIEHAIVKANGDVWTWGSSNGFIETKIATNGKRVFFNESAFALIKNDGSVQVWGDPTYGGDISGVAGLLTSNVVDMDYNTSSFVAIKSDGSVVAWGDPTYGGDVSGISGAVNTGVQSVVHNDFAYAALKSDGSVFAWGDASAGGSTAAVAGSLASGVTKIFPILSDGFAALKSNGAVVTWGSANVAIPGGMAASLSSGVTKIVVTSGAIAALKSDGSVLSWGDSSHLRDWNLAQPQLTANVTDVIAGESQFFALKSNGTVIAWGTEGKLVSMSELGVALAPGVSSIFTDGGTMFVGHLNDGTTVTWDRMYPQEQRGLSERLPGKPVAYGVSDYAAAFILEDGSVFVQGHGAIADVSDVETELSSGVVKITVNEIAAVAVKDNGKAIVWGGGMPADTTAVASQLTSGVVSVTKTERAFAALKSDGSVVVWGEPSKGGNPSAGIKAQIASGVVKVASTRMAFAALKSDGSVVAWGDTGYGADTSGVTAQISSGVVDIVGNAEDFAVIKSNGTVVSWGGGTSADSSSVAADLVNVVSIVGTTGDWGAFAALRSDGSVVSWGDAWSGGDASGKSQLTSGVTSIVAYKGGFAAMKDDDSAVIWYGPGAYASVVTNVESVVGGRDDVIVKKKDGSAITGTGTMFGEPFAQFMGTGVLFGVTVENKFFIVREDGAMIGTVPQYIIEI